MRTYKEEEIKKIVTSVDEITCDICGKKRKGYEKWSKAGEYMQADVEISLKTGDYYPEFGSGEEFIADICPDCFVSKLVPFIELFGSKVTKKEWGY